MFQLSEKHQEIFERKIRTFKGDMTVLESAIGSLVLGQYYGWRVLRMCHSSRAWNKYEKIIGLKFKEVCPEYTVISERNVGIKISRKINSFWAVVQGKVNNEGRRLLR